MHTRKRNKKYLAIVSKDLFKVPEQSHSLRKVAVLTRIAVGGVARAALPCACRRVAIGNVLDVVEADTWGRHSEEYEAHAVAGLSLLQ